MAVIRYNTMPDQATQDMIKARGDTIELVKPNNNATAPATTGPAGYANPSAPGYQQGVYWQSPVDPNFRTPMNPLEYATPQSAGALAAALGGQAWAGDTGGQFSAPQQFIDFGGGSALNAGLLGGQIARYGINDPSVQELIRRDAAISAGSRYGLEDPRETARSAAAYQASLAPPPGTTPPAGDTSPTTGTTPSGNATPTPTKQAAYKLPPAGPGGFGVGANLAAGYQTMTADQFGNSAVGQGYQQQNPYAGGIPQAQNLRALDPDYEWANRGGGRNTMDQDRAYLGRQWQGAGASPPYTPEVNPNPGETQYLQQQNPYAGGQNNVSGAGGGTTPQSRDAYASSQMRRYGQQPGGQGTSLARFKEQNNTGQRDNYLSQYKRYAS